ncbi:MAG: glycosyltransferase [Oscillospiraceae bacterium]|nr:glycosyltransferase [Oscillospiraceae bacterium]
MNNNPVRYDFKYVNNSDSIMLFWVSAGEKITYKVYANDPEGTFKEIGATPFNFFVMASEGVKEVYVEAFGENGEYLSESQVLEVSENSNEIIALKAVRSCQGVTLSWSESSPVSSYYLMKKTGDVYSVVCPVNLFQITVSKFSEGDTFKIVEYTTDQNGDTPVRMSKDLVIGKEIPARSAPDSVRVSVVIPVLGGTGLMPRCIDSVLASSLNELEVIIADGSSNDKAAEIADWYKENYPGTVSSVKADNPASAINAAIEAAKGEFIAFADSTDIVSAAMYLTLYAAALENKCDVAVCEYYSVSDSDISVRSRLPLEENAAYDPDWLLSIMWSKGFESSKTGNKLFRAELVKEHPFPEEAYADIAWLPYVYSYALAACYVKDALYCCDDRTAVRGKPEPTVERAAAKISACECFMAKGNSKKHDYLLQVAVRIVIRELLTELPHEVMLKYISFLLVHKEEILANLYIAKDNGLSELLGRIFERFTLTNKSENEV